MKEARGNITATPSEVVVVTTNGYVKANGECVMGRGIAKEVADRVPELPRILGAMINKFGNHVHYLGEFKGIHIVSFPVKPISAPYNAVGSNVVNHMVDRFKPGDLVPGWACKAQLSIIQRSIHELETLVNNYGFKQILCPRFGCGAGELSWDDVRPMAEKLDDRFTCMTF